MGAREIVGALVSSVPFDKRQADTADTHSLAADKHVGGECAGRAA